MPSNNKDKKVNYYRISIIDDQSHKQLWVRRLTRNGFFIAIISVITVMFAITFSIIAFTPIKSLIPGNHSHNKFESIQTAMTIDSLENVIKKWNFYSENLKKVIEGEDPIKIDSIIKNTPYEKINEKDLERLQKKDSILRQNVTEEEQFGLSDNKKRNLPIEGKLFFAPLKGVVSQGYTTIHPYIDITAPANSVVMAALDGTVINAGWSDKFGYTIEIQHPGDIITIYKHNQRLMKNIGDKVSAGTPIAIVGNTGSLTTGDHLHFELWYKGEPVDPTKYIKF